MKRIIFLSVSTFLLITSCDKVSNPIVKTNTVIGSKFITRSNKTVSNSKKILLEDFTGHRCLNCPDASRIIKNELLPVYNDNLIVIGIHQGDLSAPFGQEFPNDYRTDAGDVWGSSAGFGKFDAWPTGLINRKNYNSNGLSMPRTKWTSVASLANNDPFILKLDVVTEYDTTVRALNLNVKGTFKMAYTNPTKLVALFLEDGIASTQIDGPNHIEDYEFEHMLRGDINGTWGTEFTTAAVQVNDSTKWSITGFPLPTLTVKGQKGQPINDKNVTVVVYAYDSVTREVLQAEKVKIR